jgi:pSer/pThr/pTyr-binding forkhead associated (FHA) protein/tetratricopeptide (TPR) repeat protein
MNAIELYIAKAGEPERRVVLQPGILQIGRAEDNDVVLADVGVSRRHARLEVTAEGLVVEDLGSGNGTWYRGKRVDRQVLGHGDELFVDPFTLRVQIPQPTPEDTDSRDATAKAGAGQASARLTVVSAHRMPQRDFPLVPSAGLTIGRSERNAIVLPEPASSRVHAELAHTAEGWVVRDMGSSNGTFVNARRVKEKRLDDGDRIRIGTVELRFTSIGAEAGDGTEAYNENLHEAALPPPPPPPQTTSFSPAGQNAVTVVPDEDFAGAPAPWPPVPVASERPTAAPVRQPSAPRPSPLHPPVAEIAAEIEIDPARSRGRKLKSGRRAAGGGGFFSRPINQISLGILAIAFVLVGGKIANDALQSVLRPSTASSSPATLPGSTRVSGSPSVPAATAGNAAPSASTAAAPAVPLDPVAVATVDAGMAEGMKDFGAAKYFDAAAAFYRVLQVDPHNRDARRMGYVACEFITLSEVRTSLVARTTSDAAKAQAKTAALTALSNALAGSGSLAEARTALDAALALAPDDAELRTASDTLTAKEGSVARAVSAGREQARAKSLDAMVQQGQSQLSSGQYASAVRTFEGVLSGDPSRATPAYYAAEEGIRTAKDRMKADSKAAWSDANAAMKAGDWVAARSKLRAVLKVDPFNDAAQSKLAEAQKHLKEDASEVYKEARLLEDIQQTEKALALYQKVIRYVDDPGDSLSQKAQARMDALLR